MRYRKLTSRVPVTKLLDGFNFNDDLWDCRHWNTGSWHQLNESDDSVRSICSKLLNRNLTEENSDIVLHIGKYEVPPHRDCLAKSVYLIPLRFTPTMLFYVLEHWGIATEKKFKRGHAIQFNDWYSHGIVNEHQGKFLIISVSMS